MADSADLRFALAQIRLGRILYFFFNLEDHDI